jgi:hypothetical protein
VHTAETQYEFRAVNPAHPMTKRNDKRHSDLGALAALFASQMGRFGSDRCHRESEATG